MPASTPSVRLAVYGPVRVSGLSQDLTEQSKINLPHQDPTTMLTVNNLRETRKSDELTSARRSVRKPAQRAASSVSWLTPSAPNDWMARSTTCSAMDGTTNCNTLSATVEETYKHLTLAIPISLSAPFGLYLSICKAVRIEDEPTRRCTRLQSCAQH